MENLLLLFALYAMENDPKMRETLRSFLAFYRDNRDLIAAFTKNEAPMSETTTFETPSAATSAEPAQEKSRPPEEAGNSALIEQLLGRL